MAHDAFISYSSKDKPTADAVVATLEARGVRCWVAPRDVTPGVEYAEALVDALHQSQLMVLVFSSGSNQSQHVLREVERAVSQGIPILPLRIENVPPSRAMEYYISSRHWLDALNPPLEKHLEQLAETARLLLSRRSTDSASKPEPNTAVGQVSGKAGSSTDPRYSATSGLRFGSGMASGAALPRVDGQGAIADALHAIAAAIADLPRVSRRAAVEHPKRAVAIVALALIAGGFLTAWMMHRSNPLQRAELALDSGSAEGALRHLEGADNTPKAALIKGRALYSLKRPDEGIVHYKQAAQGEPTWARKDVLRDLAQSLGGRQSQEAADLLVQAGEPAVDVVVEASRDEKNSRRRWAAIDTLKKMHREDRADVVAAYLIDLKGHDCTVVSKAAKSLGELGDKRAIPPLREVAQRKNLLFDACEVPAARAALRKLEKK